ncbi:MAG: SDR family oxidoreductase [Hyphomicrobiales bacterium]|nr:SDR family oxidoreductase [Hyphomicrobiales bacterium]
MDMQLKDRIALVTGGTRDVGREISLSLAAEGAAVAVHHRESPDEADAVVAEIRKAGGKATAYQADLADHAAVQRLIRSVIADFGGLNILVNNAGLAIRKPFKETTPQDWHAQVGANLMGAIHLCHEAATHLEKGGDGRIIAIVGESSRVGESGLSIVAAARAGVIGLIKSLARELGRSGVTANTLALGMVETGHDPEWLAANRDKLVRLYPVRRLGQPDDIAPTVTLLASPRSGWITGQVISISGGYSMV